jgi:ubiquinone/menaquinone biosynthesis C-methylase UbiE
MLHLEIADFCRTDENRNKPNRNSGPEEMPKTMESKTERVKALFEISDKYLGPRGFDIRIRVEIIGKLLEGLKFDHVLDLGCGNGAISMPLLPRAGTLTLVDLSGSMLELASRRIPPERVNDVKLISGDFLHAKLAPGSFDLVLCIGVLAHVDSPSATMKKVTQFAKPGGWIVLEFTDSSHFTSAPVILYQNLLKLVRPEPYPLNRLRRKQVLGWIQQNGLVPKGMYRYGLPPLGTHLFADQDQMYRMTKNLFGPFEQNRNKWLGNEYLYFLQKSL